MKKREERKTTPLVSLFLFYLFSPIPSHKKRIKDREKLGTKAVREEYHGNGLSNADWRGKLLYGWNTLTANVWLPSLIELVGYNPDSYTEWNGCYYSAMQGLNISNTTDTDKQGGAQFAYFQRFNVSGGGERLWACGGSEQFWTRSSVYANQQQAWRITNAQRFDWAALTYSHAVHPAGDTGSKSHFGYTLP